MKSGLHLLTNSTWNAAAFVVAVGLNLLALPFVVFHLGVASFGVAGLVAACVAPALIFSSSLSLIIVREFAQLLTPERRPEARDFFATSLFIGIVGSLAIGTIIVVAGPALARHVFSLSGDIAGDLHAAFVYGVLAWAFQCLAGIFLALFTARQDYARLALAMIVSTVVSTGLMFCVIPLWPQPSTYLGCQMAGAATNLVFSASIARLMFGGWLSPPALHRRPFSEIFRRGKWLVIGQSGGVVSNQTDRYLLGIFLSPQNVGYYLVAQRLEEAIYAGILKVGEILFPFFASIQGHDDARVGDLFFRSAWVLNVLAVSALGAVIPVAGEVLYLWAGADVATEGQNVLSILAIAGILGCGTNVFRFYLLANGRTGISAINSMVTAFSTLSVGAVVLPYYGWIAAGWSSCAGALAQIIFIVFIIERSFKLPDVWPRIWYFIILPMIAGVSCALMLRAWVGPFYKGEIVIWWQVAALYGMSVTAISACVIVLSVIGRYRAIFLGDIYRVAERFLPVRDR